MKLATFILLLVIFMTSCTREKLAQNYQPVEIEVTIPVYEQESVSRYEIQSSDNGIDYGVIGGFKASIKTEDVYKSIVDIGKHRLGTTIYMRVKSIDIDGKFEYSNVFRYFR